MVEWKKHLHNFMIGTFKGTFQTVYLNEICFFLYLYVYVVLFTQETYMVLIMHKTILTRLRKSWLINYFFIHSLKSLFIREDWGLIRREFTVNLNSCLFLFLKYRCPSAILETIYMRLVQKWLFKCSQKGLRKLPSSRPILKNWKQGRIQTTLQT